jgi:DNA adenine methylase
MTAYHGGKSRHGKEIANVIKKIYDKQDKQTIHGYIEPFCGMCSVLKHVVTLLPTNLKYMASDQHESLILMWKALQKGWKPPKNCSISKYNKLKYSNNPSPEKAYVGFAFGYGGIFFCGQHRCMYNVKHVDKSETMCLLGHHMNNVKFTKQSYEKYDDNICGYIIYCDPPYDKRSAYYDDNKNLIKFDSAKFWEWCRKMSKYNIVIVSEFSAPPDFKSVHTFNNSRRYETMNEFLFMYDKYFI